MVKEGEMRVAGGERLAGEHCILCVPSQVGCVERLWLCCMIFRFMGCKGICQRFGDS